VWVLVYAEDLSNGSLWYKRFEKLTKLPYKIAREVPVGPCWRSKFSSSESDPVTYQTGSKPYIFWKRILETNKDVPGCIAADCPSIP
jgi:hypothetical protein